jgi:predicted dehydrogenase
LPTDRKYSSSIYHPLSNKTERGLLFNGNEFRPIFDTYSNKLWLNNEGTKFIKEILMTSSPIRFAAIGLNHGHIYGQVSLLLRNGAELVSYYAKEADLSTQFGAKYPQARLASSTTEILEDEHIQLVVCAGIPAERAPLGIEVMRHAKDFMSDKPGFTTLEQIEEARTVQAETGRIYSVCFSERFENPATVKAGELVQAGAIGQVVQTIGMGPHRTNLPSRPWWYFKKEQYGGILVDIGSHQFDQFLFFTGSSTAEVVHSQVANYKHPQYPELEDFGDVNLRSGSATGYIRVDWYTPDGLATWGDTRLFVLGTEGYIEVRKNIDLAGRTGANHLFITDHKGTTYIDCSQGELPYGRQLLYDVLNRTETAMPQTHCFLASELSVRAEMQAARLGNLKLRMKNEE